ncbi:MAG: PEGA domain-containing protein [Phycisphaerales bacterium]
MKETPPLCSGFCFAALALLSGCQDRRLFITSEPAGARVILNDAEVGTTPCEVNFTYFGVYDVRLRKDGFEPLVTTAKAEAPVHEWPGVDLAAMAVPVEKKTRIEWHFTLSPEVIDDAALLSRAAEMHGRASMPETDSPLTKN